MKWGMLEEFRGEQLSAEKMLFRYNRRLLSFTLNSTLNTLPTPDNLCRWGKQGDPSANCALCGQHGVRLSHILAGCPYVLEVENAIFKAGGREDRITWRHNNILRVLAGAILAKLLEVNKSPLPQRRSTRAAREPMQFVRPGEVAAGPSRGRGQEKEEESSLLDCARDWVAAFDLPELRDKCARNPPLDAGGNTRKTIDVFFYSRQAKVVVLGPEITCPMEENVLTWRAKKYEKYNRDMLRHIPAEWKGKLITIEVGCRGYIISHHFRTTLRSIGFSPKEVKHLFDKCSYVARLSSLVIWRNRFNRSFDAQLLREPRRGQVQLGLGEAELAPCGHTPVGKCQPGCGYAPPQCGGRGELGVLPPASLKVSRAARLGGSGAPLLALVFLARASFLEVPRRPLCFS